jgi:formamidopyrimidine-DNA glycosylase
MPELPDLQVFSRNLDKRLKGKKVESIKVPVTKKLKSTVKELNNTLRGQSVKKIYREGKELHIEFSKGDVLGLHLMLNGDLHLFDGEFKNKHTILEIFFDDETGLALTDWQQMATPTLNPETKTAPDALELDLDYLKQRLSKTRTSIKNLLLDQKIIRGIGNAYADEILWDAGISPFSASNKIPAEKVKALAKSIKSVLHAAEKNIMKKDPDIISGEVRDFLLIHNAKKKESPGGDKIQVKAIGGRKTYFTSEQELFQ